MIEDKQFKYLYKITNIVNDKIYVGIHSTNDLDDGYMGSGRALRFAKSKYGLENFKKEIISFHQSIDELNEAEALIVNKEFVLREDTYNLRTGGTYTPQAIESRLTNSLSQKRYWANQSKEYISHRMSVMGRKDHWSSERFNKWRENISTANKGNPNLSEASKQVWLSMPEESKVLRNKKISNTKKKLYSEYSIDKRRAMTSAATEASKRRIICKYCNKSANIGNHNRWHGENCKLNPENMT